MNRETAEETADAIRGVVNEPQLPDHPVDVFRPHEEALEYGVGIRLKEVQSLTPTLLDRLREEAGVQVRMVYVRADGGASVGFELADGGSA